MSPSARGQVAKRFGARRLFESGGPPLQVSHHLVEHDVVAHDHDFLEIVLVTSGKATHQTIYGHRRIGRGDLIVLRPWFWHAYRDCQKLSLWNCCLAPQLLGPPLGWIDQGFAATSLIWAGGLTGTTRGPLETQLNVAACRDLTRRLQALADAPRKSLELVGRLYLVLHTVMQHLGNGPGVVADVESLHPAVRRALDMIETEPNRTRSLDELARHARIDRSYLVRLFRRQLDVSPIDLLLRLRCERAAGLLLSTDDPVAEVGRRVGWDDASYFTKRFRANFGQSPSDYRRTMRGE